MPEPNRPPYRIDARLEGLRMWQIAEAGYALAVMCDACPNFRVWTPGDVKRTFAQQKNKRIEAVAMQLHCRKCRSKWIRIAISS